jgi:chromosome segregation ATPase
MAEENPPEFKFSADDQDPEAFYREEIKDLRVEKLSQRIMLLSILLPILIGVAIFFAYRDLTGRVDQGQDIGLLEVQRLSRKLEEISKNFNENLITFSTTLSSQDKDFNTTVSGKLAAVNKNIDALNKNLKSLNKNLNQTRSTIKNLAASKADKKSQVAAIAKINAALKPLKKELKSLRGLRQELKTVSTGVKSLESTLDQKLAEVAAAAEQSQKDTAQLQTSITRLSDDKIDKDTFGLEAFKLKKNFQNHLSYEITAINQKLDSIQKKIDDLQSMSKSPKRSMKSLSKKTSSTTDKATASSKPGSIDEQDLPE